MKKILLAIVTCALWLSPGAFAIKIGDSAPDFTAATSEGKMVKLADFKDKIVVLEWTNHGCPFVKKHYNSDNMQNLQKELTGKGVIWLSVISSGPGQQGYSTAPEAESDRERFHTKATAILLDAKGKLGKLYGAQTTPHMFVIDQKGKLAYQGAIDDKPSTDLKDVQGAKNYVRQAVNELLGKNPVSEALTKSYGCGVKYDGK